MGHPGFVSYQRSGLLIQRTVPGRWGIVAHITPYNEGMALSIRPAMRGDVSVILDFIRALAAYEREPGKVCMGPPGQARG